LEAEEPGKPTSQKESNDHAMGVCCALGWVFGWVVGGAMGARWGPKQDRLPRKANGGVWELRTQPQFDNN